MPERERSVRFRIIEPAGPGGRIQLLSAAAEDRQRIVISGFAGPALPATLTDPVIAQGEGGEWHLSCAEGSYRFRARAVDRIDERPGLYLPLHRPFALSGPDRLAVRVLMWLLRLPGGARLLRRWQAGRGG